MQLNKIRNTKNLKNQTSNIINQTFAFNDVQENVNNLNSRESKQYLMVDAKNVDTKTIYNTIDEANPRKCLELARELSDLNIYDYMLQLENVIVKKRNLELVLDFARDIKNANISRLQKVVECSFNPYYCLLFAKEVKGADIPSLIQVIADSGELEICIQALTELNLSEISKELLIFSIKASMEDESLISLKLDIEDMLIKNGRII